MNSQKVVENHFCQDVNLRKRASGPIVIGSITWAVILSLTGSLILAGTASATPGSSDLDTTTGSIHKPRVAKRPKVRKVRAVAATPVVIPTAPPPIFVLPGLPPITEGKWAFDGAVRARVDVNWNEASATTGDRETKGHFGFDTLILNPNYTSDSYFASAKYRFYGGSYPYTQSAGYEGKFGEFNFLQFAYAGVKLSKENTLTVGLQQVPFGITPYFSSTYYETLGFVMGIEEVYNTGIKFEHAEQDYDLSVGYFPVTGGKYFGISADSARYSTNIVNADSYVAGGTNNQENNMLIGKIERVVYNQGNVKATIGASTWDSLVYNYTTGSDGSKEEEAVHFLGTYGGWSTKVLAARLDINPRNPNGQNQTITVGGYDGSYNLATHGFFVSDEVAYDFSSGLGPFSDIQPYVNYSAYFKDNSAFETSQRFMVGTVLTVRGISSVYIYPEFRFGQNDPYTGAGQYTQGLAAGGDNHWKTSFNMNIGYYW